VKSIYRIPGAANKHLFLKNYERTPFSSSATLDSFTIALHSLQFSQQLKLFTGWSRQPHAQPPTWRAKVSLFVWIITFDLSDMGDPTSSYTTASIALRIIWPRKPHHYVKVRIPTGGMKVLLCGIERNSHKLCKTYLSRCVRMVIQFGWFVTRKILFCFQY
jgi:hypothetical protein